MTMNAGGTCIRNLTEREKSRVQCLITGEGSAIRTWPNARIARSGGGSDPG